MTLNDPNVPPYPSFSGVRCVVVNKDEAIGSKKIPPGSVF